MSFERMKSVNEQKRDRSMELTRNQFDVLEILATTSTALTKCQQEELTGNSVGTGSIVLKELTELGFVEDRSITDAGINALEPYRAKRAIFIAAGFGKRLVPITLNTPKPLVRVHGIRIIDRLIDACIGAGINEICIVRGYRAEQFDELLYKYPMVRFLENPVYNEANNISSALVARYMLSNAYVFEADLLISNPTIIKKYHYTSDFLAIKKDCSDDWCFKVKNGVIEKEMLGGQGDDIWQMVGISYWSKNDGYRLSQDLADVFASPGGKDRYWEQVPLVFRKENYHVAVRECRDEDIVEIDTFKELKAIDKAYEV